MANAITDTLDRVTDSTTGRPVISSLASPGKAIAATSINLSTVTNWTTTTAIHFSIYNTVTVAGVSIKDTTTQTDWKGTLAGSTISNLTLTGGTDQTYTAGAIVELTPTARWAKDLYDNISTHANQDGSLKTSAVQTALNIGTTPADWTVLATPPSTITYNGNRSYSIIYPGVDYTGLVQPGSRLRFTRTVAAPTQCTSLNGTNQYYSKTSPAGMTFTNNFVVSAWVKLTSYSSSDMTIASRWNGTSGWALELVASTGLVSLRGWNGSSANFSMVTSYQSIPLNKWVHVTAQLDMLSFTATPTTSYVMIDGVDVPAIVARAGTSPTALVQAGNLEIGSGNGGTLLFPGKIAQVAIYGAKVTEANIRATISQGLLGTETSLISAYSFNNAITDLNVSNANNLTANGSAVATNADSPFGGQAGGAISSTLEYLIAQNVTFSGGNTTVIGQVPEGGALPTTGGISTSAYSSASAPFGFPRQQAKWRVSLIWKNSTSTTSNVTYGSYSSGGWSMTVPIGEWRVGWGAGSIYNGQPITVNFNFSSTPLTGLSESAGASASRYNVRIATPSAAALCIEGRVEQYESLSVATTFILYSLGSSTSGGIDGGTAWAESWADNAYL